MNDNIDNQNIMGMDIKELNYMLSKENQAIDDQLKEFETAKKRECDKLTYSSIPEELEKLMDVDDEDDSESIIVIKNPNALEHSVNEDEIKTKNIPSPTNNSLRLIADYRSSDESSDSDSSSVSDNSSSEDSDNESSDSSSSSSSSSSSDDELEFLGIEPKKVHPIKAPGECLLDELPLIEDLHITVPETECTEIGKIQSIVDQLVLVESISGTAALDLDSVLFLDKGNRPLGRIFDVLGQISCPLYCIRFNSRKQIEEHGIEIGMKVYFAPKTEHTSYVILSNLMNVRGSDASWRDDIEPNDNQIEYSDDEQERAAKKVSRKVSNPDQNKRPKTNDNRRNYYPNANHHNQPRFRGGGNGHNRNRGAGQFQYRHIDPTVQYNHSWHYNLPQSHMMPGTSYANPYAMSLPGVTQQQTQPLYPNILSQPPPPPPPPSHPNSSE